jgi:hypothetical protein
MVGIMNLRSERMRETVARKIYKSHEYQDAAAVIPLSIVDVNAIVLLIIGIRYDKAISHGNTSTVYESSSLSGLAAWPLITSASFQAILCASVSIH